MDIVKMDRVLPVLWTCFIFSYTMGSVECVLELVVELSVDT